MKKTSILLLAIFFIGIANINAQSETTTKTNTEATTKEVKEEKTCTKTGKVCPETCKKKKDGTCCQSKKTESSCTKTKKGAFNFNKTNNYSGKSSCSKSKSKTCCKSKAKKATTEEETTEEETTDKKE